MSKGNKGVLFIILVLPVFIIVNCSDTFSKDTKQQLPLHTYPTSRELPPMEDDSFYGGDLIITLGAGSPVHLNPALISGFAVGLPGTQIFSSPLRYDENWNPQPYIAERWDISDNGLVVTLHLVKDAEFHDGHKVTAEDVAFSIQTVKTYHPFKSMFEPVEKVETPDPYTVVIFLSRTHPAILLAMSPPLLPILPKHIYDDGRDIRQHPKNMTPIGCGPYVFKEFIPGEVIRLEKNRNYFIENRPFLDTITIYLDSDPNDQMIKMERGEAHLLPAFSEPVDINTMSEISYLSVTDRGYEAIGPLNWLAFNLFRPPLDNILVRQAIAYAIDMDFITDYLHSSRSIRAKSPIAPNSPFYEDNVPAYNVDLKRSGELLDQAGYPVTTTSYRFSLTCDFLPVLPSQQEEIALYLKRQLKKVNIDVQVRRSENFVQWAHRVSNWDFDMTLDSVFNWGDPVIGVHRTYMSDNIRKGIPWSNTQHYKNPRVDELLKNAGLEVNHEKRKKLYSEFQKLVVRDLPIVWINVTPLHTVYNSDLKILPTSIWGLLSPFDTIYWKKRPFTLTMDRKTEQDNKEVIDNTMTQPLPLHVIAERAIQLIVKKGLYKALTLFNDTSYGFLDIEGSGLHVIGFTKQGIVFFDNSHQMKSGMDISNIIDNKGTKIIPQLQQAAINGTGLIIDRVWPHPGTNEVGPLSVWCGKLGDSDTVCALCWLDNDQEE